MSEDLRIKLLGTLRVVKIFDIEEVGFSKASVDGKTKTLQLTTPDGATGGMAVK